MKQTIKNAISADVAREIEALRIAAANPQGGLRMLQEMELGWVAGGDTGPMWTAPTP